jgi:hypothetical protein
LDASLMANDLGTAKPEPKSEAKADEGEEHEICTTAIKRYSRWLERERDNIDNAYEDLRFRAGEQWPMDALKSRQEEKRPILTENRIPQFVKQITGDMRQMKPSIKVVPVDSKGDRDTAETIAGMIRYVENRSDASSAYMSGADSQVTAGIGHWRVTKEYAAENTFNQEIRIMGVDDGIAVAWDPDAVLPTREDAKWCIVPVDMSREAFTEQYPDVPEGDFDSTGMTGNSLGAAIGWYDKDMIRVAEYWVKKPCKRTLALFPDGSIIDLTDKDEEEQQELAQGARKVEDRDGFKICRYLITAMHVLEEIEWPGMYIPIIPCLGEEVRIGRKIVRHGIVRFAKDAQRMMNYYSSTEAEVVALQPKAPWLGTEKNFEKYQAEWAQANNKAFPYLPYQPDSQNGGAPPSRVQPPVSSQGLTEGHQRAADTMKAVIGIYDAGLGNRSNETSGKAIIARQREGDVGSFVYIDNWTRAIRHTGKVVLDLIPHVYDSERMIRIMGDDGKVELKWINRAQGMGQTDPETGEDGVSEVENDLTVGAYDVVMESGPSYTTKREEAKDSMLEFMKMSPNSAPVIMDLFAKAQDWPMADDIGKRFEAVAPPPIQALLHKQKQESGQQEPPDPQAQQQMQQAQQAQQMQQAGIQLELEGKHLANEKTKAEIAKIASEGQGGPDPVAMMKAQAEQQKLKIDADRAHLEHTAMLADIENKQRLADVELEIKLAELAIKKQGLQLDTAAAALDLQSKQQGLMHDAERHASTLVQGIEKHQSGIAMGAESHAAKIQQMNKPEAQPSA